MPQRNTFWATKKNHAHSYTHKCISQKSFSLQPFFIIEFRQILYLIFIFRSCCCDPCHFGCGRAKQKKKKKIASYQNENHSWIFFGLQIFFCDGIHMELDIFRSKQHGKNNNEKTKSQWGSGAISWRFVRKFRWSEYIFTCEEREKKSNSEPIKIEINTLLDIVVFSRFICGQRALLFFFTLLEIMER